LGCSAREGSLRDTWNWRVLAGWLRVVGAVSIGIYCKVQILGWIAYSTIILSLADTPFLC
jgi:hypothetical protein